MPDVTLTLKAIYESKQALSEAERQLRSLAQASNDANKAAAPKTGGWRQGVQDIRDLSVAAAGVIGTVRGVAQQIGAMVDQGLQIQRATHALETYAGGTDQAAITIERMRDATAGMVSDFDLTTSAVRFFAMGIAETSDEAARFAEIAVTLGASLGKEAGASMEEFALLMANQSIPRLDTFGISAAQVRTRIKELKDEGYAMEDAFRLAVLEQGTKKMEALGGAAEIAGGDINRLGAKWENLVNQIEVGAARAADAVAEKTFEMIGFLELLADPEMMKEWLRQLIIASDGYEDFVNKIKEAQPTGFQFGIPSEELYLATKAELQLEVDKTALDEIEGTPIDVTVQTSPTAEFETLRAQLEEWGASGAAIQAYISTEQGADLRAKLEGFMTDVPVVPALIDTAESIVQAAFDAMEPKAFKARPELAETAPADLGEAISHITPDGKLKVYSTIGPTAAADLGVELDALTPDGKIKAPAALADTAAADLGAELGALEMAEPVLVPVQLGPTALEVLGNELATLGIAPLDIHVALAEDVTPESIKQALYDAGLSTFVVQAILDEENLPDVMAALTGAGLNEAQITAVLGNVTLGDYGSLRDLLAASGMHEVAIAALIDRFEDADLQGILEASGVDDQVLIEAALSMPPGAERDELVEWLTTSAEQADRLALSLQGVSSALGLIEMSGTRKEIMQDVLQYVPEAARGQVELGMGATNPAIQQYQATIAEAGAAYQRGDISLENLVNVGNLAATMLEQIDAGIDVEGAREGLELLQKAAQTGVDLSSLATSSAVWQTPEMLPGMVRDIVGKAGGGGMSYADMLASGYTGVYGGLPYNPATGDVYTAGGATPWQAGATLRQWGTDTLGGLGARMGGMAGGILGGIGAGTAGEGGVAETLGVWAGMLSPEELGLVESVEQAEELKVAFENGAASFGEAMGGAMATALSDAESVNVAMSTPVSKVVDVSARITVSAFPLDELARMLAGPISGYIAAELARDGQAAAAAGPPQQGTRTSPAGGRRE